MPGPSSTVGDAPLDTPAPPAAARAHAAVHLDIGAVPAPLYCAQHGGRISIQIVGAPLSVWLTGTPDELHDFARQLHRLTNDAVRELVKVPNRDVEEPVVLPKEPAA